MRIDKFLWCVRLFPTRVQATDAVKREHVRVNAHPVKASATVKVGDTVAVRTPPIWRSWTVIALPTARVGARLVPELITETTPLAELERLETARRVRAERPPGAGRPTKRERRDIDRFRGE